MSINNQPKGFALIELIISILIISLVVGIGYLVYYKLHKQTPKNPTSLSYSQGNNYMLSPPPVPNNHAYLGVFDNPLHIADSSAGSSKATPGSNVVQQLATFNKLIGKKVSILHFYMPFDTPLPTSTLNAIKANGSMPLISWGCTNVVNISTGKYDSFIESYAEGLKAYKEPVFLRWYWEFNQINKDGAQPAGAKCGGYNNGKAFIAAWQHIYNIFQKVGAQNVAFVWCPGYSGGNFNSYYPGDQYVNWIGLDRYERTANNQPLLSFSAMFSSYYNEWLSHDKPIMIAETAAMGSNNQSVYLNDVLNSLPSYPDIKAFVYFDAIGPAGNWQLEGSGISAFQKLANSQYFSQ